MQRLLMRNPIAVATLWIVAYVLICLFPLAVALLHPAPVNRNFWVEFSVALGFIGLAMMVLQFVLTARVNRIETSYGIDILIQFHRFTSLAAFFIVVAHPLLLFVVEPDTRSLLNFFEAPLRAQLATIGTLAFLVMVVTTIWRKPLKIPYEPWRLLHSVLAVVAVGFGFGHGLLVGNYLSLFWKVVLWSGLVLAALWLIVYVRLVKPWMMTKKPYLVEEVLPQRGNVYTLALRPQGHDGFTFEPGQFAWLTLGVHPVHMREHPFSMSSCADQSDRIEFGIKALGDFTRRIKDIKPGTKAYLDGPYGVFTTERYRDSSGFVLIAGGIGITPMYSMLQTAIARKDNRSFQLLYAAASWDDVTYREELEAMQDKLDLTIVYVLRKGHDGWEGATGYVDQDLLKQYIPHHRGSRQYFICAAPVMMDAVESALFDLDVPVTHVHMEHFNLA
ncbi:MULTISPECIES: ferric reductase-like transmembrane domain-containing protein [Cyanophyceae]|uniref:ferredoxin reductase family protein n=1 Tax=Cyanophyceae TaxID=3028117 RepID=UPI0016823C6D|nr:MULTISPECIES: ferric reductase-like transmembrane domain-containing protein [Cyanophyceae]MBD1914534.1 ferric reductase-like transmembrane domain-containing protein [Phormidium sp. FACHB-77]MBD2029680.1 ferric reductase-like transmembrane domain-containing protein [Phormidium sp. FACHB-322]MBD2049324.1 ferric reductase-like transmembrane domain-containing protein [Leptolyngbya sp. FACHB-60]